MSTVLSADFSGNPLPLASWQDDFEREIPYFERLYRRRFRYLTPELRDEQVQEALAQTAIVFANQYKRHGGRTEHRHSIARYIARRVRLGRSCTRPNGQNADLLDRTDRTTGPQRETEHCLIAVETVLSGSVLPHVFRLDLLGWIDTLPDRLCKYATLAYRGTPDMGIRQIMGVSGSMITQYRRKIKELWVEHENDIAILD